MSSLSQRKRDRIAAALRWNRGAWRCRKLVSDDIGRMDRRLIRFGFVGEGFICGMASQLWYVGVLSALATWVLLNWFTGVTIMKKGD